jgi:hypothetical protein
MPLSQFRESLDSADLDLLQRVLGHTCKEQGIAFSSAEAEAIAAHLVRLWQSGRHDEENLLRAMVRGEECRQAIPSAA